MGNKLNRTRPAQKETRGKKNEGRLGRERETPPSFFPPYFFPRKFFAGALIFCPLPTIRTPGTGYGCWELVNYMFMHCVHNCKDHSSFDSISVVLIILHNLFHIHFSHKNNVRTNSKENTGRLLMTLKIQVDGQDDKNNEHTGMKNVCSYFFFFF